MAPPRPKSARSRSEASSSRPSRSSTPTTTAAPPTQQSVRFAEAISYSDDEEFEDIIIPLGYDPAADLNLLLAFLHDREAPDSVKIVLPRLLESARLTGFEERTPLTPFPVDQIKEIVHIEVEKILKEVKASFADKATPAPASGSGLAPRSYTEAATKSRLFAAPRELRVHPRTIRKVTYRVPTKPDALTLTLA